VGTQSVLDHESTLYAVLETSVPGTVLAASAAFWTTAESMMTEPAVAQR
jgi:hypothetical protein